MEEALQKEPLSDVSCTGGDDTNPNAVVAAPHAAVSFRQPGSGSRRRAAAAAAVQAQRPAPTKRGSRRPLQSSDGSGRPFFLLTAQC